MIRFTLILASLFTFVACSGLPASSEDGPVKLQLNLESADIERFSDIEAEFAVSNISDKKQTFSFSSGCQYGYTISRQDAVLLDSRENQACIAVFTSFTLEPGQSKVFAIEPQSNKQLQPGTYSLSAFLLEDQSGDVEQHFFVK